MVWEFVFMMVVLKAPIAYLCAVAYWAIKAEPRPLEGAARTGSVTPDAPTPSWRPVRPRRPRGSHGGPVRGPVRGRRALRARLAAHR